MIHVPGLMAVGSIPICYFFDEHYAVWPLLTTALISLGLGQILFRVFRVDEEARIHHGMNDGGLLVLSEKVVDENAHMEELLVDLHHEHKRRNDYSQLEISRKRAALENVLVPETVAAHKQRLAAAGFGHSAVWLRYFNFVSIVAIK